MSLRAWPELSPGTALPRRMIWNASTTTIGFGQFVLDGIGVASERIQRGDLDTGGEPGSLLLEPVTIGLPQPVRDEVKPAGVDVSVFVAGVVNDAGDHAGARELRVGPNVLVDSGRVNAGKPFGPANPALCLGFDAGPDRPPGNTELVGQGGDGGVVFLQYIRGHCPWHRQELMQRTERVAVRPIDKVNKRIDGCPRPTLSSCESGRGPARPGETRPTSEPSTAASNRPSSLEVDRPHHETPSRTAAKRSQSSGSRARTLPARFTTVCRPSWTLS